LCAGSPAVPSRSTLARELSLRSRFFAEIPERPARPRTPVRLDREFLLPAVLPSLPCGEWQFLLRRSCSTTDLDGAQWCPCKRAPRHRDPLALLPNAARDALPLLPCAKECLCAFRRALARRDRGRFVPSRLPPASCALQHRSFADDLSAPRPCRIKAQRHTHCSTKTFGAPKARHSRQSPPQDGFAVANLGQRPRIMEIRKTSALKARFTSG